MRHSPLAELLINYLERSGLDSTELADRIHVRHETLICWLNGKVSRPRHREDILRCACSLGLNAKERDKLLQAAGFSTEKLALPMPKSQKTSTLPISLTAFNHSPFVIGPPITEPRQFFGREYMLKRIFDLWHSLPLQHVAIVGPKRSGKTSLMHYLRRIIDTPTDQLRAGQRNNWLMPGYQWVFVDFQDPRMCYQEGLLRHILQAMDLPIPEPCDLIGFMEITEQYLSIPTIILLDEISAGLNASDLDEQFWWGLRSLGSNHAEGRIGFLLSAAQLPEELAIDHHQPSPFLNIFGHVMALGPMKDNEALELIHSSPQPFTDEDAEWIMAESHNWPALLQIFCHARLMALEEAAHDESWQQEALRRAAPYRYLLSAD